jgi:hypothetical protein
MIKISRCLLVFFFAINVLVISCGLSEEIDANTLQGLTQEAFVSTNDFENLELTEERRLREKEEKRVMEEDDRKFFLPEDKLTNEEWEDEILKKPWKNWVFKEGDPITTDFINTSSNTLVITILDYDAARKDGIFDQKIIKNKYNLYLVLYPGDKYVETKDGHNGIRLARYLQAHKYCDDYVKYYGSKIMDRIIGKWEKTSWDLINGIPITLDLENGPTNIVAYCYYADTDQDGIDDIDEIKGTHGFVTHPTFSDTDGDGIPDMEDKNPLRPCRSKDPSLMPDEWVNYWIRIKIPRELDRMLMPKHEMEQLREKLALADGDFDGDGFSNSLEKELGTQPIFFDKDTIVFLPKEPIPRKIKDGYELDFSFLVKTNIMTRITLHAFNVNRKGQLPSIKFVSAKPIKGKMFPRKSFYVESARLSGPNNKVAIIQPMTVYRMKIIWKCKKWIDEFGLLLKCQDAEKDLYCTPFGSKNYHAKNLFEKFYLSHDVPNLIISTPKPDYFFIDEKEIPCRWTKILTNYWNKAENVMIVEKINNNSVFPAVFAYQDSDTKYLKSLKSKVSDMCFSVGETSLKTDKFGEFETLILHTEFNLPPMFKTISNYVPIFKTVRANEECSYVFKTNNLRIIRLQAKYGKDKIYEPTNGLEK